MTFEISSSRSSFRDRVATDAGSWPGGTAQLALAAAQALPAGEPSDLIRVEVSLDGSRAEVRAVAEASPAVATQDEAPRDPGAAAHLRAAARDGDDAAQAAYAAIGDAA